MDKTNPADWYTVKLGSIVTISDAQAIQDSMRRGLGVRGIDYTVQSVERCDQLDGLCTHLLFTLSDPEQNTNLLVKIVDGLVDLFLYFEPADLSGGRRSDLLERGLFWLFQEPADPNHFTPSELRYTVSFSQNVESPSGPTEVLYQLKSQGELQANHTETPKRQGMSNEMLATIVEYRSSQATENPEFLILEVGETRSDRTFVRFFQGCSVKLSEVDVLGI